MRHLGIAQRAGISHSVASNGYVSHHPQDRSRRLCFAGFASILHIPRSARMKVLPRQGFSQSTRSMRVDPWRAFGAAEAEGLEPCGTCEHGIQWREGDRKAGVGFMVAQLP